MVEARPRLLGARGLVLVAMLAAGLASAVVLDLRPTALVPNPGGLRVAREFLAAAFRPAFDYEAPVLAGTSPFLLEVARTMWRTVVFAAAAMSLALLAGLPLGMIAADSWWREEPLGGGAPRPFARSVQVLVRVLIAVLRSVHELLWAVVFLAAMGTQPTTAVIAIAIPFAGTLAKVFSEMIDEAPTEAGRAMRALGASRLQVYLFGVVPRALPDMAAYSFYRFECAIRSSAILGFFGYETFGYHLELSFGELHYREVWTYLYAMVLLVVVLEGWSASLRSRMVA